jgi:hypothetical protein
MTPRHRSIQRREFHRICSSTISAAPRACGMRFHGFINWQGDYIIIYPHYTKRA